MIKKRREERTERRERNNHYSGFSQLSTLNSQLSPGFGLLEVLIAGGILALVAGATVSLAASSLRNSVLAANRTEAFHLAQEGVELIRQMRDTTYIDDVANRWDGLFPAGCRGTITDGKPSVDCALVEDPGTGSWQVVPGGAELIPPTPEQGKMQYSRSVMLAPADQLNTAILGAGGTESVALQAVSTVSWQERGRTISVQSATLLGDWRPVQ